MNIKTMMMWVAMLLSSVVLASPCFADFGVEISIKKADVTLYESKPLLLRYSGNTPVYSNGDVLVHVVLTNLTDKDQTIILDACHTADWDFSNSYFIRYTRDCSDYDGAGPFVLKSKEKLESDVILGLDPQAKPGDKTLKFGYDLGYVQGEHMTDWSNEVTVHLTDGTPEQKERWTKETLAE